ncbi:MAG: SMP-30/gluconolactonase/LRE family protein [Desulfobacterales bacterium]|nr:SMP-30/gluconolactonase/LRE family protein [Desulfobacterales bacterium]
MKAKGFVLIMMLFMMLLIAVTATSLNRRAGLQARMAANQTRAVQTNFDQLAVMEQAAWELTKNPLWHTTAASKDYTYNGTLYTRTAAFSTVSGSTDAVTVSVTRPGAAAALKISLRYYMATPINVQKPRQVRPDSSNNIYFADSDNHSIWRIDAVSGAITRVAGNGASGSGGDGGPATQAQLTFPMGVCIGPAGHIYIADSFNHRIRKVDAVTGMISTVAGTGSSGSSGDNGPATSARLDRPYDVYADAAGNLFIADRENHRIRKVAAGSGTITTVAGTSSGDSGDGGPAVSAKLTHPQGVFVDAANNIYVADTDNSRIRKFTVGGNISTVAGTGGGGYNGDGIAATSAQVNKPEGVFKDSGGNIYVADTENNRIRKFTEGGNISTFAGTGTAGYTGDGGPAASAMMDHPEGVGVKSTGQVILADTLNLVLRQVAGGNISTLSATPGLGLNQAEEISMDPSGNVYIADSANHRIRKLDTGNVMTTAAGTGAQGRAGDSGSAVLATLDTPSGVAADGAGNFFIADTNNCRIRKVTVATGVIDRVAGKGGSPSCTYSGDGGNANVAELNGPEGVFAAASGIIYIADTLNHRIRAFTVGGLMSTVAGTGSSGSSGDGGPATAARLDAPEAVFADAANNIFIADTNNHKIRKVTAATGIISTVAGTGAAGSSGDGGLATAAKLNRPRAVFADAAGNLFIADASNNKVRVVSAGNNFIYTLAGTGSGGFDGDNLPAAASRLNRPYGVTMAAARGGMKIYIGDRDNNRIRTLELKIEPQLN